MPADIREYLIDRFRSDAETLRERAAALQRSRTPMPGPDAGVSLAMSKACDDVASLAELLPERARVEEIIEALQGILPELTKRAMAVVTPPVKSVYVGACTRVQQLIVAEKRALSGDPGAVPPGSQFPEDLDEEDEQ